MSYEIKPVFTLLLRKPHRSVRCKMTRRRNMKKKKTRKLLCFVSMQYDESQASNAWSNKPSPVVHLVVDSSGLGLLLAEEALLQPVISCIHKVPTSSN